ncbi:MAG: hypothetical protein J7501_17935 [Bdellovibrio sp.]|nr:hypothetical protein [Bdellovibrio sp.]
MKTRNHPARKTTRIILTVLLLAALPVAISVFSHKVSQNRQIASTNENLETAVKSADLSDSSPEEFMKAFKYQILKDVKTTDFSDGKRLQLGFFIMRDEEGQKVSVCDRYPVIELTFSAEGVAHSGDVPTKTIKAACRVAGDQLHLEGVAIDLPQEEGAQWNWTGLKLLGQDANDFLEINGYEIISVLGAPLSF